MRTLWFPHVLECYLCFCHEEAFVTPLIIITLTCMKDIFANWRFSFCGQCSPLHHKCIHYTVLRLCESIDGFFSTDNATLARWSSCSARIHPRLCVDKRASLVAEWYNVIFSLFFSSVYWPICRFVIIRNSLLEARTGSEIRSRRIRANPSARD
jgi:hypothetical protein